MKKNVLQNADTVLLSKKTNYFFFLDEFNSSGICVECKVPNCEICE